MVREVTQAMSHIDRRFIACGRAKGQQSCECSHSQPVKVKALRRTTDYSTIF